MRTVQRTALALALGTLAGSAHAAPAPSVGTPPTITEIAQSSSDFRFLVEALRRTNLLDTFDQAGSYTVFAPTNAAFQALPSDLLGALLTTELEDLSYILQYHVIGTELSAGSLRTLGYIPTLTGQRVAARGLPNNRLLIDGVEVVVRDIQASNGVVHVIESVLLPNLDDIVQTAQANPTLFTTLVDAVGAAGLVGTLQSPGPFTVFAPTDDAFMNLPPGALDMLLMPQNQQDLIDLLLYHVVPGRVFANRALDAGTAETALTGQFLSFSLSPQFRLLVNGNVTVISPDVDARNGVIHVIDTVLTIPGS